MKVTPFLWFDHNAIEVANFYISIFRQAKILSEINSAGDNQFISLDLAGNSLTIFNGGPHFKFNEAFSLFVDCEDQEEVDYYWNKLIQGGKEGQCGWLKDKYGLSWQIVPRALGIFLQDPDRIKADRALQAMLKMKKIDVAKLTLAFEGN